MDGTPIRIGYLLFNVSIPPGEVVTKATLKLFTPSTSSADTFVHQVSNTEWSETATTYSNAPPIGAQSPPPVPTQGGSYVILGCDAGSRWRRACELCSPTQQPGWQSLQFA